MYKKLVKKRGRIYSYYYHNVREGDKVKNVCLGSNLKIAKEKLYGLRNNRFNLLDNAPGPGKSININFSKVLTVFLILILGFGFLYFFNEITGLTIYENSVSLGVNDYLSKNSYVVINVNNIEYKKNIEEFNLELVDNKYYVDKLVIDLDEFDLQYGNNDIKVELYDYNKLISSISQTINIGLFKVENVSEEVKEKKVKETKENITEFNITSENITEIIENITIEEEISKVSEVVENITEIIEVNISEEIINETNITIGYVIEEENITIFNVTNITEVNITNITEILENITEINITETLINETNITVENITISNLTRVNFTVEIIQGQAEINKIVKWVKKIRLENKTTNLEIEMPKGAFDISVENIENKEKINKNKIKVKDEELKEINLITGDVVLKQRNLLDFIKNLFRITGFATIDENKKDYTLIIEEEVKEIEVVYYTRGPEVFEEEINDYNKKIIIYSDIHYTDVLAYTNVSEYKQENIKLYWIVNESKVLVNDVKYIDTNNNSLIDKIYWNVPYLSNQTYEVTISILNVQSYPTLGGNWTVMFNTTGIANLTVTAVNGTTFTEIPDNLDTLNDLEFLELKCGNNSLENFFLIDSKGDMIPYEVYKIKRRIEEIEKRLEEIKSE